MHIIVLEKYPSSQRGGQERSLFDVTQQLAQRGHRITLLHASSGDLLPKYEAFCDRVIPIRSFSLSPRIWQSPAWFLADLWNVLQTVAVSPDDTLVYINQIYDSPFAAMLSRLAQVPLVCHLRLPSPKQLDILRTLGVQQVQHFISVSEANRQEWRSRLTAPIEVVHNGVSPDRFIPQTTHSALRQAWQIPQDDRVICYVGRLDRGKGLETLLNAFEILLKTWPALQLLIAGKPLIEKPSYQKELEQLSEQLGIADRVRFLGHVTNVIEVFQVSDLSVLPSHWEEPFGRTIIESMMAGTPVVASHVGGISEILTGEFASGLFTARDVDHLAQTIASKLNWRQEDPLLGDRVLAYATEQFNLENQVDAIEKILLNV
jgi:glycosyltransferase involved in cell wall biosynthesis